MQDTNLIPQPLVVSYIGVASLFLRPASNPHPLQALHDPARHEGFPYDLPEMFATFRLGGQARIKIVLQLSRTLPPPHFGYNACCDFAEKNALARHGQTMTSTFFVSCMLRKGEHIVQDKNDNRHLWSNTEGVVNQADRPTRP